MILHYIKNAYPFMLLQALKRQSSLDVDVNSLVYRGLSQGQDLFFRCCNIQMQGVASSHSGLR